MYHIKFNDWGKMYLCEEYLPLAENDSFMNSTHDNENEQDQDIEWILNRE